MINNKNETPKQLVNGKWIDAVEEPYYPSIKESLQHRLFGKCVFYENHRCLICGATKT